MEIRLWRCALQGLQTGYGSNLKPPGACQVMLEQPVVHFRVTRIRNLKQKMGNVRTSKKKDLESGAMARLNAPGGERDGAR